MYEQKKPAISVFFFHLLKFCYKYYKRNVKSHWTSSLLFIIIYYINLLLASIPLNSSQYSVNINIFFHLLEFIIIMIILAYSYGGEKKFITFGKFFSKRKTICC